ncbi:uncharacterized protein [Amphiura filiformis]|uniref:uncharacterized protein n=1 Tax=Amphiura filiformis TaxID=82378 RepID=UPI003B2224FC
MWQQPDPDRPELGLHWVLSYTNKDVLCTCTKILFGGMNPTPLPRSENFFYPDDLNNDNVTELREKLGCTDSKAAIASSTSQSITKSESSTQEQLTTEAVVASTTKEVTTNPGSTGQLTTEADISSSTSQTTIAKAESSTQEQLTTDAAIASTTSEVTTNPGSTGQLTTKGETSIYVCEGETLHLECEESRFIDVTFAIYGRRDGTVCNGPVQTTNCAAGNSLEVAQSLCNRKQMCGVQASNGVFGTDPCGGIAKYLEISFRCI